MFLRVCVLFLLMLSLLCSCSKNTKGQQILRLNLYTEPPSLDPRKSIDVTSANVLLMLFDGLTRIENDHDPTRALAQEIAISEDQLTYTFTLRDALWSNGDEVTSDDFLYSWQKTLDPTFPASLAYELYPIKNARAIKGGSLPMEKLGVRAPDSKTLVVTLEHPTPYFLELTAIPLYFPVHRLNDKAHPEWSNEASSFFISNGPFRLVKWDHENELVVEKNPLYWDSENVFLKKIEMVMIDDAMTEFYMFEQGEIDWAGAPLSNLPSEVLPELLKNENLQNHPALAVYYYVINTECYPLQNLHLRKALGYSVHRKDIVDHILQGGQTPALALVPPGNAKDVRSCYFLDGDHGKAKEHFQKALEELNLTKETFPMLTLSYNSNRDHQKIAQAIQQQWMEVLGIRLELENCDWKVYLSKIGKQDFQIARFGWVSDFHDPIAFLEPFKYKNDPQTGGNNDSGWNNPKFTALLNAAERELDRNKRSSLLWEAEALLMEEMPIIPIYYIHYLYLKKPHVADVSISSLGYADFKRAFCCY